jgi:hypothetical protein
MVLECDENAARGFLLPQGVTNFFDPQSLDSPKSGMAIVFLQEDKTLTKEHDY